MFKNLYDTIIDKISNLNPIRPFIKYALDRTLNEFLTKELTLDDFKNGPLNLNNIEINIDKINREHLISSPYILHHGVIGFLKISLPPLSQISTQSIEISVSDIQVSLKPNKKFSENFKQKMIQLNDLTKFYVEENQIEGEISENGPVDFFKQLLKKIIMNIKIKISNVAIKLYMNTPSSDGSNPQYYALLRVPIIHFDKKEEKEIKRQETQQLKFNVLVPQLSVHLLREDIQFPDYSNMKCKEGDFPFKYPCITHPSTILLIGAATIPEGLVENLGEWRKNGSLKNYSFSNFGLALVTDFKKKTRQISLKLDFENIEAITNPVQLKVLSRFIVQILQFKKIFSSIIEELKDMSNGEINLNKQKSQESVQYNSDFFSSIVVSISQDFPGRLSKKKSKSDLVSNFMKENPKIRQSISNFNKECQIELMKTMRKGAQIEVSINESVEMESEFHAINFTTLFSLRADFTNVNCYILKYLTILEYERSWLQTDRKKINEKMGCSHFMLTITKGQLDHKSHDKLTLASFKKLKVYNVKLMGKAESSVDDYFDIKNSVEFYSIESKQAFDMKASKVKEPELHTFKLGENEHYCIEEIVRISQNESEAKEEGKEYRKYNFIPKFKHPDSEVYTLFKPGFSLQLDKKQNYLKINVQIVTISVNFQILQDILNIVYPIFTYKRLSDLITFKKSQLNLSSPGKQKMSFMESHYEYRIDLEQEQNTKMVNRNVLIVEVEEVKFGFRTGGKMKNFQNLARKTKEKVYDQESFNNQDCFCQVNEDAIYLQLYGLQFKSQAPSLKVSTKKIQAGLLTIRDSSITNMSSILVIETVSKEETMKVFKDVDFMQFFSIYIPTIKARLEEKLLCSIIELAMNGIKVMDNLIGFQHYLKNEMMIIQHQSQEIAKKQKKNEKTEKEIRLFIDRVEVDILFIMIKAMKVYFTNSNEEIVVKVGSVAGGIKNKVRSKMCEFRNQEMMIVEYQPTFKHKPICDSNVLFQINDSSISEKSSFKSTERNQFFKKVNKSSSSINFRLVKRQAERQQRKSGKETSFSQKFKFKQLSSTIEEEGEKQIISVHITKNIITYACNIMEVVNHRQQIIDFVNCLKKSKSKFTEMQSQAMSMIDRKESCQIENQSIQIGLRMSKLLVDVRPEFIRNGKERIFGNTRSLLQIQPKEISFFFNKMKNIKEIQTEIDINLYFLKNEDREIDLNPILFPENIPLADLGFKNIFDVSKLALKLILTEKDRQTMVSLATKIKNIFAQCSLQTLMLLKLHMEYFVKHHVKRQYGISLQEMYENQEFCNLEYNEEDDEEDGIEVLECGEEFIVEDLSDSLKKYEQKLNKKIDEENKFKMRSFVLKNMENASVNLNSLTIEKIHVRIYNGNDFNFHRSSGLADSSVSRRFRNKEEEENRYLSLTAQKAELKFCLSEKKESFSTLTKVEKLKVAISKQKFHSHHTLKHLEESFPQQQFIICENDTELSIMFEKTDKSISLKTLALRMKLGVTSELVSFSKKLKEEDKAIERSGWKKIYDNKEKKKQNMVQEKSQIRLIVIVPESQIRLSLQYENLMNILDDQSVITSELIINEQFQNTYAIKNITEKWGKKLLKDNIGAIISKTAFNLLLKLIGQIVAFNLNSIAKLLGFINLT